MNYFIKSVSELKLICKENNIKNISGKNKQTLINLIQDKVIIQIPLINNNIKPKIIDIPIIKIDTIKDTYTEDLLKEQYILHKTYVNERTNTTKKIGVKVSVSQAMVLYHSHLLLNGI